MKLNKIVALSSLAAVVASSSLFAGTKSFKETVIKEEAKPAWNASLSTGWDSLYMFRGVNVLRGSDKDYGDGLYWTGGSFTYNLTDSDSITISPWQAFGMASDTTYKEFDLAVNYAHTIDKLTLGLGYTFYDVWQAADSSTYFANEISASVAYNIDLGFMSLVPSVTYYYNLGPDNSAGKDYVGAVSSASSYLNLRLDSSIPVTSRISLAPYVAYGINFRYNYDGSSSLASSKEFNGSNNVEYGVALPIKINDTITLSGYVSNSIAFENLNGLTRQYTTWGGAKVTFSF